MEEYVTSPAPEFSDAHSNDALQGLIRREFSYASESPVIQELLLNARPLAGRTWNAYIGAITASPQRHDIYAKNLLNVAVEIIRELYLTQSSPQVFEELKKLARDLDVWPGFISAQKSHIEESKAQAASLELGANDGRAKKRPDAGIAGDIAHDLLRRLREYAADHPSKMPIRKEYWELHHLVKTPPPFDSEHAKDWSTLASFLLDYKYGPTDIRQSARRDLLESLHENPYVIPKGAAGSLGSILYEDRNERYAAKGFVEDELNKLSVVDAEFVQFFNENFPRTGFLKSWETEPPPCILAYPAVAKYCSGIIKRKEGQNEVQSAKIVYTQLKKDILRAVKARLPKSTATTS